MKKLIKEILYAAHECGVCPDWGDKVCDDILDILKRDNVLSVNEEELDRLAEELNPNNPHGDTYEVGQYFGFDDGFKAGCRNVLEYLIKNKK